MIKSTDVRLGNLLEDRNGKIVVVDMKILQELIEGNVTDPLLPVAEENAYYRGTLINDDILIRLGFQVSKEEDDNNYYKYVIKSASTDIFCYFNYSHLNNGRVQMFVADDSIPYSGTSITFDNINYVHRLQNLFYGLFEMDFTLQDQLK